MSSLATKHKLHRWSQEKAWAAAPVYFIPFVGPRYEEGLTGTGRVLLLGESHYGQIGQEDPRRWTLDNFSDYLDPSKLHDQERNFFRRLAALPCLHLTPTSQEKAAAWSRVAFANYVQSPVGPDATHRPENSQWDADDALLSMLNLLRPDFVLVLGRTVWNRIKIGNEADLPPIPAERRARRLWEVQRTDGTTRMTWVYHPSRNMETDEGRIAVFRALLEGSKLGTDRMSS